ncbi:MAG TPA: hypothetical protein VEF72_31535 [Mycobacterium sp.]|nr:hypothetical protein [Mycobacterium sp.]
MCIESDGVVANFSARQHHVPVGHRADVSVTQPVVDEGEQLAGRGDLGDIAARSFWRWWLDWWSATVADNLIK